CARAASGTCPDGSRRAFLSSAGEVFRERDGPPRASCAPVAPTHERASAVLAGTEGGAAPRPKQPAKKTSCANERECPRQESNLGTWFRKPLLYPLSYGGAGAG